MTRNKMHENTNGPAVAVDTVVMGIDEGKLKILVLQIGSREYQGKWALPGGLIQIGESPESAARRVLEKKTNIKAGYLEQLYTFGDPKRDVRGQIISIAYFLLVRDIKKYQIKSTDFYSDIQWIAVNSLPAMAFDHQDIIAVSLKRLQDKLGYSNIAYSLVPKLFTLTQLQIVYEIVLGRKLDKRNFRKRILGLNLLKDTFKIKKDANRPAKLYQFKKESLVYFE